MKKLILITLLCLPLLSATNNNVYVCTGKYAKVYHCKKDCKGLDNCGGEVESVKLEKAKQTKRACKICYK